MKGKTGDNMLRDQLLRIRQRAIWSWEGFIHVFQTEGSLMQWIVANGASALLAFLLPLSAGQRGTILMGGIMVLAAECMNTAIERVVDDVSEERRPRAKQAKDAGSAAVAVTAIGVGVAWVCALVGLAW
jgi:diacylglycerol kinase (ATP)